MLEAGHPEARRYPLGMVHEESILVQERRNGAMLTEQVLLQQTISAMFAGKKGAEALNKTTAKLNVEVIPIGSPEAGFE